jgi:hypothetical protein
MPKVDNKKEQSIKSRREERAQSSAPYPGADERMGAIASMLEAGDGSAYMNPEDLEARTAQDNAESDENEGEDNAEEGKPSFNALTAAEMNVRIGEVRSIKVAIDFDAATGRENRISTSSSAAE